MKSLSILAVGVAAVLGMAACSSEKQIAVPQESIDIDDLGTLPGGVTIPDITIPDFTLPDGGTIPDFTIPGGGSIPVISADCQKYLQALSAAFSGDQEGIDTLEQGFAQLAEVVPEDLKDDLEVLSEDYGRLADALANSNGDVTQVFSNPEILQILSDPKFTEASTNFTNWLQTECAAG